MLEDEFPLRIADFQGLCENLPEGILVNDLNGWTLR